MKHRQLLQMHLENDECRLDAAVAVVSQHDAAVYWMPVQCSDSADDARGCCDSAASFAVEIVE